MSAQADHVCRLDGNRETCRLCAADHAHCNLAQAQACCLDGQTCTPVGSHGECCIPDGQTCAHDTDCCTGHLCGADFGGTTCFSCGGQGERPRYDDSRACCAGLGLDPSTGRCEAQCVVRNGAGQIETNPDTNNQSFFDGETFDPEAPQCIQTNGGPPTNCCVPLGICERAHIECPTAAELAMHPGESGSCVQVGRMTEVCNGLDDDCNGHIDDVVDGAMVDCPVPAGTGDLQEGCPSTFMARCASHCADGLVTLDPPTGWCAIGDDGGQLDHHVPGARASNCFPSGQDSCITNHDCLFGTVCCGSNGGNAYCVDDPTIAPGTCWLPNAPSETVGCAVSPCSGLSCGECLNMDSCGACILGNQATCLEGGASPPSTCAGMWLHGTDPDTLAMCI